MSVRQARKRGLGWGWQRHRVATAGSEGCGVRVGGRRPADAAGRVGLLRTRRRRDRRRRRRRRRDRDSPATRAPATGAAAAGRGPLAPRRRWRRLRQGRRGWVGYRLPYASQWRVWRQRVRLLCAHWLREPRRLRRRRRRDGGRPAQRVAAAARAAAAVSPVVGRGQLATMTRREGEGAASAAGRGRRVGDCSAAGGRERASGGHRDRDRGGAE
jgi:hypothetical protein